jgi:hypothetical protein
LVREADFKQATTSYQGLALAVVKSPAELAGLQHPDGKGFEHQGKATVLSTASV